MVSGVGVQGFAVWANVGIEGRRVGQPYAHDDPDARGANVGVEGRQRGAKKAAAGRGDIQPPLESCGNIPHEIAPKQLSLAEAARSSKGRQT